MKLLSVSIVEYVDDAYPGWVKAVFNDSNGRGWSIEDKTVYFGSPELLDSNTIYPQTGQIECQIIAEHLDKNNRVIFTIDIGAIYGLNAEDGKTQFDVFAQQVSDQISECVALYFMRANPVSS